MNYIELFMRRNFIAIDEKFAIKGCKKYSDIDKSFYFDSNYNLKSKHINREHNSIFLRLLSGIYSIVVDIKS